MTRTIAYAYDAGLTQADLQKAFQQSEKTAGPLIAMGINFDQTETVSIHQPPVQNNLAPVQLVDGAVPAGATAVASGSGYVQAKEKLLTAYR